MTSTESDADSEVSDDVVSTPIPVPQYTPGVQPRTSSRVRTVPQRFGRDTFAADSFKNEDRVSKRRRTYIHKYLALTEGGVSFLDHKKIAAVDVGAKDPFKYASYTGDIISQF